MVHLLHNTPAASAGSGAGAWVALGGPRLGSMRALALGSTTLARTWEPSVAEVLAARFGSAVAEGWAGPPVALPGIAAMPSGGCAQRLYAGGRRGSWTVGVVGAAGDPAMREGGADCRGGGVRDQDTMVGFEPADCAPTMVRGRPAQGRP